MKRKSRPESLLQRLNDLQWAIYCYQTALENKGQAELAELAGESAFELDVAKQKMEEIIYALK